MKTLHLLLLSLALPVFAQEGFQPLFNGQDLSGWDGEPGLWKVVDGVIVGTSEVGKPKTNSFLIWNGKAKDFELRATVKVVGDNNSGAFLSKATSDTATDPVTPTGDYCNSIEQSFV